MTPADGPVWLPTLPPDLGQFLAVNLQPVPVLPIIGILLGGLYLAGVIRMRHRRLRWPVARTLSFLLGCALLVGVTGLGIEGYGYTMFSVFMFQQLSLMIAIPPLLVLGAPGRLLLRSTPHYGAGAWVLRVALWGLRARASRFLLNPFFATALFLLAFYGLYLGGLIDPILSTWVGHTLLELGFLVSGILFATPILSPDPQPLRQSHVGKILDVSVEMALHAFFGVIIMVSTVPLVAAFANPPASLGVDPILDQQIAGGLAWSYGEGPTVLILIYVVHRWFRDDTRAAARADRVRDRDGDPDLDAYNRRLAHLNRRQEGE